MIKGNWKKFGGRMPDELQRFVGRFFIDDGMVILLAPHGIFTKWKIDKEAGSRNKIVTKRRGVDKVFDRKNLYPALGEEYKHALPEGD